MSRFMKLAAAAAFVMMAGCVATIRVPPSVHSDVDVSLVQVTPDEVEPMIYGPLVVEYDLTVYNCSPHTLTLHAVDLHSAGGGTYHVAQQTRRLDLTVPPGQAVTKRLHVSAWAAGGMASAYEPVTIHGALRTERGRIHFEAVP